MTWAKLRDPGNDMAIVLGVFAAEAVWITLCAWYLEQVTDCLEWGPEASKAALGRLWLEALPSWCQLHSHAT